MRFSEEDLKNNNFSEQIVIVGTTDTVNIGPLLCTMLLRYWPNIGSVCKSL